MGSLTRLKKFTRNFTTSSALIFSEKLVKPRMSRKRMVTSRRSPSPAAVAAGSW
ncbi:hypothetical protein D3C83_240550 [compost metagenome]